MAGKRNMARGWKDDWFVALELAGQGASLEFIAEKLGRSLNQVMWKFDKEGRHRPPRGGDRRSPGPKPGHTFAPRVLPEPISPTRVPPDVLAQREARYQASLLRSRTQELLGDPPPGFSALDKKRQREGATS